MEKIKSTRFIGALVAAIVLVLALAACDSGGGGGTSGKSNADLLKDAAANMKTAKTYHIDLTANSAGQDIKMAGDVDVTNTKSKLDMTAAGQSISVISIGTDTYLSMDGGTTFTKSDQGASLTSGLSTFTSMWESFKADDIDKAKDALKDGSPANEKVGTDDTHHISGNMKDLSSLSATGGGAADGTIDIWVTTGSTPTVRKMVMNGTSSGQTINATIEWSNVNGTITIDAPATP